MIKRTIAFVLSAFLCATAITSGAPPQSFRSSPEGNEKETGIVTDDGVKAANSLGRYFQESAQNDEHLQKLSTPTRQQNSQYEITGLDFDISTGMLSVISTQSSVCKLIVNFIDETTNELVSTSKIDIEEGQMIQTDDTINTKLLPEYFIIKGYLTDSIGTRLCNDYIITTYTQRIQEIKATDISSFDADRVINFDESEQTNFLVLSEDTIKAEASDEYNSLVSADYDNNVFVIENADETVRNLSKGQYFYFQPNEKDIIAVSVDEIDTEDNLTTIKGNSDIKDMFEFVKFESITDTSDAVIDNSESNIGYEVCESDTGKKDTIVFDQDDLAYEMSEQMIQYCDTNYNVEITKSMSVSAPLSIGPETITPSVSISETLIVNFYQDWLDISIELRLKTSASFSVSFQASVGLPAIPDVTEFDLCEITIPTSIPALTVPVTLKLQFNLSGEVKISYKTTVEEGFYFDTDNGVTPISVNSTGPEIETKVSGSAFLGVKVTVGAAIIDEDLASFSLFGSAGIKISGTVEDTAGKYIGHISGNKNVLCTSSFSSDSIHACDTCIKGTVNLVVSFGLTLKVTEFFKFDLTLCSIDVKICDWFLSLGTFDPNAAHVDPDTDVNWLSDALSRCTFGLNDTCHNKAYKTTLNIRIEERTTNDDGTTSSRYITNSGVSSIKIGDVTVPSGKTIYCRNGTYTAYVTVNGKTFSAPFTINGASRTVSITGTLTLDGNGGASASQDNMTIIICQVLHLLPPLRLL